MREIDLDASSWRSRDHFYDALLPRLGAPSWHGRNLDALEDSIRSDAINAVRSPYFIRVSHSADASPEVREYLEKFANLISDIRASGLDVGLYFEGS